MAKDRVGELAGCRERLELVAEVGAEEVVDRREHLRPGAVVAREREQLRRPLAALPEHLHVGVPEPVDRLELVADEEDLLLDRPARQRIHELALEAIRVLELVDHDHAEAQLLGLPDRVARAQQVAREELEVLEVERRLPRLGRRVLVREPREELLEQVAVARGELLERRLLDALARLLEGARALAATLQHPQVEQALRIRPQLERLRGASPLEVGRLWVVDEAARRVAQGLEPLVEARPLAQLELEVAPGRAQRLVDAREHPPQPVGAVGRKQPQPLGIAVRTEPRERALEGLSPEDGALRLVELAEAGIDPDLERVCLEQARAEAVDRRDPGAVERAGEVVPVAVGERLPDPCAQLAGRLARVRDHEHGVDVDAAVADGAHEPLHEHRRLPGAGPGGDEDLAVGLDGCDLLGVQRRHARGTRHIVQRSHQAGHSPPFGSWRTSPARMRPAYPAARSRAVSTCAQNSPSLR